MTLEEAQAKILELNENLTQVTNERDAHLTELTAVKEENESLRKLNQNYFNKLSAQIVGGSHGRGESSGRGRT